MDKSIYDLELHEWMDLDSTTNFCVYRVPGGWIYTRYHGEANQVVETFVPFNNEFQGSAGVGSMRWRSVEDELPEDDVYVLGFADGSVHKTWRSEVHGWGEYGSTTHWMPLPEPPKC